MKTFVFILSALLAGAVYAPAPENTPAMGPNAPFQVESDADWEILFDGKTTQGWKGYGREDIGSAWKVMDGALVLDDSEKETDANGYGRIPDGGDIVTTRQFGNFELMLEWKISPCGNSGIMFNVVDSGEHGAPYFTGPEIQIVDNACHPDAEIPKHRAGDLYDLISCKVETVKPAGEWNEVRLMLNDGHLQEWLNGTLVVDTHLWNDNWSEMVANSKFKQWPAFGKAREGHICLQDHNDKVSFRNIKVREL